MEQMQQEAVQKADGLIVIGKCNKEALLEMKQHYHSVVCVNRNATSGITDEVICDGRKIAQMAVEYLIVWDIRKSGMWAPVEPMHVIRDIYRHCGSMILK